MAKPFKGVINLDVRDSVPDWAPYRSRQAPEGAPNVLIVLYDDTGLAAWSPFGGRIEMPTLQRLADNGLTYSQWHTTALCSPTRSCFLTGRNHHQNGFAQIAEGAPGLPRPHRPHPDGERRAGRGAAREGLEHVLARQEPQRARSTSGRWARPSATGRWRAASIASTGSSAARPTSGIRPGRGQPLHRAALQPEEGYHLSKDLADKAIGFIRDSKQSHPTSRGSCGSARAPTTRRTTRRRSTSTSTRASSTTATRPTASGCCRG